MREGVAGRDGGQRVIYPLAPPLPILPPPILSPHLGCYPAPPGQSLRNSTPCISSGSGRRSQSLLGSVPRELRHRPAALSMVGTTETKQNPVQQEAEVDRQR